MTTIAIFDNNGTKHLVDAVTGTSLMRTALESSVPGILGDCGGNLTCATCHCYVDAEWVAKLPPPSRMELEMLECTSDPQSNSRLSCQIEITSELDGLTVRLPASQ